MVAIFLLIKVNISFRFDVAQSEIPHGGSQFHVFHEGIADKGDAEPRGRDVVGGDLLVEAEEHRGRDAVLLEELVCALSCVILAVQEYEGHIAEGGEGGCTLFEVCIRSGNADFWSGTQRSKRQETA